MNLLKINNTIINDLQNYILDNLNKEVKIAVETMQDNSCKHYLVINNYCFLKNKPNFYQVFCKIIEKQNLDTDNIYNLLNNLLSNKFNVLGNDFYFANKIDVLQRVGGNDYGLYLGLDFESHIYIAPNYLQFELKEVEINVDNDIIDIKKEDAK